MDTQNSQLDRLGSSSQGFCKLVAESLVRFPKALQPYVWAFVWGVVAGTLLAYREPSEADKMYERHRQTVEAMWKARKEASLPNRNRSSFNLYHDGHAIDLDGVDYPAGSRMR